MAIATLTTSTIECGPGIVEYDGAYFYSQEGLVLKLIEEKFAIPVDNMPGMPDRPKDRKYELSFKAAGEWEALSVLFPHGSTALGSRIFDNTPLIIWADDGTKYTLSNAAVTKQPGVLTAVGNTLLGDVTFTGILKEGVLPGASDAYLVIGSGTHPTFSSFSLAAIKTPLWERTWGADPWDVIQVGEGGVVWDFPIELRPQKADNLGTVNMILTGRSANAKFTPLGKTTAQILAAVGANAAFGSSPTLNHFNVFGTGVYIRLYNAMMRDMGDLSWSVKKDRHGELMAQATQTLTAGALDPLFFVGTAAPV